MTPIFCMCGDEENEICLGVATKPKRATGVKRSNTLIETKDGEYHWIMSKEDAERLTDEQIRGYIKRIFSIKYNDDKGKKVADSLIIRRGK